MSDPQTFYVIDSHSLIFQVFHAITARESYRGEAAAAAANAGLTAPDGRPTAAVYGFTQDLLNILDNRKPDFIACAFDMSGPTFRDELFPEYKAHREPMPGELRTQIVMIRQVIEAFGIPIYELPGFEADDVVATLARAATARGIDTHICTSDKDVRQLLSDQCRIYNIRKDAVYDAAALATDWGVRPDQVVDFLSLTGDSVDNIPGAPGIGPKTAAALLREYGTLDAVLAAAGSIPGKKGSALRESAELLQRSRQLVRLRDDLALPIDWARMRAGRFDAGRLGELFREFGFRRFQTRFSTIAAPAAPAPDADYRIVADMAALADVAAQLGRAPRCSIWLAATSPDPAEARVVGLAVAAQPGAAWYVPIRGPLGEKLLLESLVWTSLAPILQAERPAKVGHDLKFIALLLRARGMTLRGLALDTMVADYLHEAGAREHDLDQLAQRYLDHAQKPLVQLVGEGANRIPFDRVPVAELARFAAEQADLTLRLAERLEAKLRHESLWPLYEQLEGPLIELLADMEQTGVRLDVALLRRLSDEFRAELQEMERRIYELAGGPFHIASPVQLRQVLFDKLRLPVLRRTKTGPSTDQEVLEELALQHPLPALLIEQRQVAKLKQYVDALPDLVNPDTGRVHTSFNQVVAATGRLSSSNPNLQNVPVRSERGRQIRRAFVAGRDGWLLLTADYSQVELRVLAHLSGDEQLRYAFACDQDIHSFVAGQIYGIDSGGVTDEMRRLAKTVNFGVIYGLSPFGLAARLGITQEDAQAFIDAYFARYPGVAAFIDRVLAEAHASGRVTTILGRRRRIAGVRRRPVRPLNASEREAVNTVVQGSAADMIKQAMVRLHRRIPREQLHGRMLLQIHDELVFDSPEPEVARLAQIVNEEMTRALPLAVPVRVDIGAGPNWLDVEPIESPRGA
jgi:DNA polymerase-1